MSADGKKPLWPWIVALLIGLPVLYVASFGPACWVGSRANEGSRMLAVAYRRILWLMSRKMRDAALSRTDCHFSSSRCDSRLSGIMASYAEIFANDGHHWGYTIWCKQTQGKPYISREWWAWE